MKKLKTKSKIEILRRDRASLRRAYAQASKALRDSLLKEIEELDTLTDEGLSKKRATLSKHA